MMGEDGELSLFEFPKIPRNLWTMPRLDKDVDAIAWAAPGPVHVHTPF